MRMKEPETAVRAFTSALLEVGGLFAVADKRMYEDKARIKAAARGLTSP